MPFVVDLHNDKVLAIHKLVGDVEVEGSESAFMVSYFPPVHIDMSVVVDGTEIEEGSAVLLLLELEAALQPYCPFIEEQTVVLGVPVAGNLHGRGSVEVILNEVFRFARLRISEEPPPRGIHAIVVIPFFLYVDDIVPFAVQRCYLPSQHVYQLGYFFCLYGNDGK